MCVCICVYLFPSTSMFRAVDLQRCTCYGLNICPLKFICLSPDPQGDGVWRWSLWEVIRS